MNKSALMAMADLLRQAVHPIDDGWYEAYWLSEPVKPDLLNRAWRRLGLVLDAVRVRNGWSARQNAPTATQNLITVADEG
jgi:hypothetical protein